MTNFGTVMLGPRDETRRRVNSAPNLSTSRRSPKSSRNHIVPESFVGPASHLDDEVNSLLVLFSTIILKVPNFSITLGHFAERSPWPTSKNIQCSIRCLYKEYKVRFARNRRTPGRFLRHFDLSTGRDVSVLPIWWFDGRNATEVENPSFLLWKLYRSKGRVQNGLNHLNDSFDLSFPN